MATIQLDALSEATLIRLAERRGQSWLEVLRDAFRRLAEDETQPSAYERLQPYTGICDSGGRQLSERTGVRLREQLEEKRRARGAG